MNYKITLQAKDDATGSSPRNFQAYVTQFVDNTTKVHFCRVEQVSKPPGGTNCFSYFCFHVGFECIPWLLTISWSPLTCFLAFDVIGLFLCSLHHCTFQFPDQKSVAGLFEAGTKKSLSLNNVASMSYHLLSE